MQSIAASLENKIWFWLFTGPALALLTLFVSFCEQGPEAYTLPLVALVGFAVSTLWKTRGLIIAGALLLAAGFVYFHDIPLGQWWWHGGLLLSLGLSFAISSLSFTEMVDRVGGVQVEARTHLQRFLHLDEEHKRACQIWERRYAALEKGTQDVQKEGQLEKIKAVELEALAAENAELKKQEPKVPDGHWKEQVEDLEERVEEMAIALAEAKGKLLSEEESEEALHLRAKVETLTEELVEGQKKLAKQSGLRDELNELRSQKFEQRINQGPADVQEVEELEGVVGNLLSELKKRCLPSGFRTPPR